MQGNDLFSSQLRKLIHHNHTAFKLGFVLLNEMNVQRFPRVLEMQIYVQSNCFFPIKHMRSLGEKIPAGEAGEGEEILTRLYLHITEPFLLGWLCPETKSSHFRPRGFALKLNSAVPPTYSFLVKTKQFCFQKAQGDNSPDWWLAVTLALLGRLELH